MPNLNNNTISIIGFGTFGQFMAKWLHPHCANILVFDPKMSSQNLPLISQNVISTDLNKVLQSEIIILCVPVQNLEKLLIEIQDKINPKALVLDVSSVKIKPVELMTKYLPKTCEIIATHPLFGPFSGSKSIKGLKILIQPIRVFENAKQNSFSILENFLSQTLQLEVIKQSIEEHDLDMAYVQALTFFIGKAINQLQIPDSVLNTPTYQHLLEIKKVVGGYTDALFYTIQQQNPYSKQIRQEFLEKLQKFEDTLSLDMPNV